MKKKLPAPNFHPYCGRSCVMPPKLKVSDDDLVPEYLDQTPNKVSFCPPSFYMMVE
jgi:hypothetical protein